MPRVILLATIICAVVVIAQATAPASPMPAVAQSTERIEFRTPPPTCEQAIKELALEGQAVHCIEPPAPTYDPPRIHGKYRLFPESYVGPLTYEDKADTTGPGVVSNDIEAIMTSSLYLEPAWLPEGYLLSSMSTRAYDSEHVIAAVYSGPGEPIRINRVRQFTWPIDVILPAGDSLTVFETPVLEGQRAVLYYPKPGSSLDSGQTVLSFVDGDVETTVLGDRLDPDTATRIALSLICGTSCVSSSGAISRPGPSDGVSGPSAQGDGAIELSGVLGPDKARISQATSLGFADDEHRVVAGLGLTSVRVTSWWDHGSAYGEAALDLQHPDGEDYTKNVNVYVITWPWSGSGRVSFRTDNYRHDPSYCDGRYVNLWDAGGNSLGRLTYVHLDPATEGPVGDTWISNVGTWTIRYVGKVAETQDTRCVSPYHPHLHQGQNVPSDQITYNTALPQPLGIIDPANDATNNWMFKVTLIDSDGDGVPDTSDNCPDAYNPGQQNTDAAPIDNGPDVAGDDVTVPNGDAQGDACDSDDDNDWMLDTATNPSLGIPGENVGCGSGATNPLEADTDGDTVVDGAECLLGSDPNNAGSKPPAVPPGDGDGDGLPAAVEFLFGSSDSNMDSDGDGPAGIFDGMEVKGWATSPTSTDTDGDSSGNDGCQDDKEIVSVNIDKQANINDVYLIAKMAFGQLPPYPAMDINKDGVINITDVYIAAKNSTLVEPHDVCR